MSGLGADIRNLGEGMSWSLAWAHFSKGGDWSVTPTSSKGNELFLCGPVFPLLFRKWNAGFWEGVDDELTIVNRNSDVVGPHAGCKGRGAEFWKQWEKKSRKANSWNSNVERLRSKTGKWNAWWLRAPQSQSGVGGVGRIHLSYVNQRTDFSLTLIFQSCFSYILEILIFYYFVFGKKISFQA